MKVLIEKSEKNESANSESFWSHFWLQLKIALVGSNSVGGHCTKNLANLILCLCSRVSQLSLAPTQYTWTWISSLWGEILSKGTFLCTWFFNTYLWNIHNKKTHKSSENTAKYYGEVLRNHIGMKYSFRNDFTHCVCVCCHIKPGEFIDIA